MSSGHLAAFQSSSQIPPSLLWSFLLLALPWSNPTLAGDPDTEMASVPDSHQWSCSPSLSYRERTLQRPIDMCVIYNGAAPRRIIPGSLLVVLWRVRYQTILARGCERGKEATEGCLLCRSDVSLSTVTHVEHIPCPPSCVPWAWATRTSLTKSRDR